MQTMKAVPLLVVLFIATAGCGGSNKDNKGSGGGPSSGTSSGKAITKSYFPTTSTQERQYIERRYQPVKYEGKPKPELKQLAEKKYLGRWTEPTQAEKTKYGSDVLIWSSNEFYKRRAYRVSDVGVELEDSVGGTMVGRAKRDDTFYFWKPLAKWGSKPGEVWDAKIKEKSVDQTYALNRTYSALYESTVENDGKTCVVIAFTEHNIQQEQFQLRKYWLMDGVGIVRLELYESAVYAPGHPKEEDGKWWRPVQQLIFQEWKGDVAPLAYLPRDAK